MKKFLRFFFFFKIWEILYWNFNGFMHENDVTIYIPLILLIIISFNWLELELPSFEFQVHRQVIIGMRFMFIFLSCFYFNTILKNKFLPGISKKNMTGAPLVSTHKHLGTLPKRSYIFDRSK
uniref:Uncharacterized protein n=1 Tax=Cacopsylla melanoneura TaxID=428564 RepID=A0A8D8X5E7_9HEMI